MEFGLSEDQIALQDTVRKFCTDKIPTTKVRQIQDTDDAHDPAIWSGLAEIGVLGILVPEEYDGLGFTLLDAALVSEELGHCVAPTPYVECAIMSVVALREAGTDAQKQEWLPKIALGEAIVTIAAPSPNGAPAEQSLSLSGGTLNGNLLFVPYANVADAIIVPIAKGGGTSLYLIPTSTAGVSVARLNTIDKTRRTCEVTFDGVAVTDDMRLGAAGSGDAALARAMDAGRVGIVADGVGVTDAAIEMTLDYVKTREQFGRVVGSFQAVKHMCADAYADSEPLRSFMWYAAHSFDNSPEETPTMAALAKATAGDTQAYVLRKTVECHGGIGFTEECDLQLFYKRAQVNKHLLGSPEANREVAAHAQGFVK